MKSMTNDFITKELKSLAILTILLAAALAYLIFYTHMSPFLLLTIPLIIIAFTLRMCKQAASSFQRTCGQYSEIWQNQVEREYDAAHPIYQVAYGEIHLLKTCLVCRNKRRLLFVPLEQIETVEERFRLVGTKRIPLLKFKMDTDKTLEIDFSVKHCEDGDAVLSWLIEQLGEDKVKRSQNTILR